MKVLLTGAAGFLGSHLTTRLLNEGHSVVGLDDLSTGNKSNLMDNLSNPLFKFVEHDVRVPYNLEVDAILNFACPASPKHYQADPVRTIETNFLGIINLLRLARDTGAIIIQASTSEIYGDPMESPQSETYWGNVNPIGIRSCYDEGKRMAETLAFDYHRENKVEIRVARIFNTYGPRMLENDGRVVSNFVAQALRGVPLTVYGEGQQTRSFCYVSDLVNGLMRLMNGEHTGPINLGNPDEYTILELAQAVQNLINPDAEIKFEPLPADDPRRRRPDITKAQTLLDWEPTIPLQDGLKLMIEDFRQRFQK
jgi:UDP-glucuronate decarboxylase